jgi:DNA-directed RNA polymerase subunit H (RpoH/RPB5)
MLATHFGYTSIVYLSFEPLTSYSTRVIEQKQVATHIEFFAIDKSQYNILRHVMVPYYRLLTDEAVAHVEARHSIKREFLPRISKIDPVVRWMQYPPHSVILEVPHFGTGYDASRFCYVLAVKDTEEEGEDEAEGAE